MKQEITFQDYNKVEIKVGTVLSVKKNEKARKPSLVIEIDFGGPIGIKKSSAQITHYYNEENLVGKQVIGCLLYTSPSPRDGLLSRMPSSA